MDTFIYVLLTSFLCLIEKQCVSFFMVPSLLFHQSASILSVLFLKDNYPGMLSVWTFVSYTPRTQFALPIRSW